jgi:hypothetical protein
MSESQEQTPAQKLIGDFSPKMVSLTDDVLWTSHEGERQRSY